MERVKCNDEIEHPAIREAMNYLDMHELRISYDADLPARSGLGTSSSFAVGLLNAFYALKGKYASKKQLADDAIYLERVLCDESGGLQDQIAASFGGLNRLDFSENGYSVKPIIISPQRKNEFNDNLLLFFTGFSRFSADVQKETKKHLNDRKKELLEILRLVDIAEDVLTSKKNLKEIGRLLDYTWQLKRGITNKISTESIDEIYNKAKKAGAIGGKLLGAGGGGFFIFYVEKEKQASVLKELNSLLQVPFKFENEGTKIIYYSPESYEPKKS